MLAFWVEIFTHTEGLCRDPRMIELSPSTYGLYLPPTASTFARMATP
jgi:hypothetical protein